MFHNPEYDATFLKVLGEIDERTAAQVQGQGCVHCGGPLDRADYPRKPRGELGEEGERWSRRRSFCCRREGCRKRATPPSVRFLGRKVYIGLVVVLASAAGRAMAWVGRGSPRRVHEVPVRTVRRWLSWWSTVFALGTFWTEAKAFFSEPVAIDELPESLRARFGSGTQALGRTLRFLSPITTESVEARIAMGM